MPGRIGLLRLNGIQGSLDIVVVYLETGDVANGHKVAMEKIAETLRPRDRALTVIMGDFNFVLQDKDRWNKATG